MDVPEQKTSGDNTPQTTRPGEGGYEEVERRDVVAGGYESDADLNSGVGSVNDPGMLTEEEYASGEALDDDDLEDDIAGEDVDEDFGEDEDIYEDDEAELIEGEEPDF